MSISTYLESRYSNTKQTITELSKNSKTPSTSLVSSTKEMFCFDEIIEQYAASQSEKPASADAIIAEDKKIYFIEFKDGLSRIITRSNYNDNKAQCRDIQNQICKRIKKLDIEKGIERKKNLKNSIKMKIIESYICLEKHILQETGISRKDVVLEFICVTDLPSDDVIQQTFQTSLERFVSKKDYQTSKYYYDKVSVIPARTFNLLIQAGEIPSLDTV